MATDDETNAKCHEAIQKALIQAVISDSCSLPIITYMTAF